MTNNNDRLLAKLADDGDTVELDDGRTLRLRIEADEYYNPFEETDIYGKIGCQRRHPETGRPQRPSDFDGNAEKLSIFGDVIWWQPPSDVNRNDPEFAKLRTLVSDLASWGAKVVTLEVLDGKDAYGRPIVVEVASLGGIDSVEDGYLAAVVHDLYDELSLEANSQ